MTAWRVPRSIRRRSAGRASIAAGDAAAATRPSPAAAAPAPRLSGTRGSARAYWKRAPERREARRTEPRPPCPRAGPGTRAPAAVAREGPPWARASPGGPGTSSRGSQGLLAGQEVERTGTRPGPGTRRRSRGAGCQQLQNEASSLPGILVATPSRVAQRQAGTGAPRPAERAGGPGRRRSCLQTQEEPPPSLLPATRHDCAVTKDYGRTNHAGVPGCSRLGHFGDRSGFRASSPFPKNISQHVDLFI